ncbi:sensor histidine kinase [Geodermatophilus nigrescens]|uniref:histidine kinase n=1 Tax=Geodermatophilus nigrescens TaxID=1070870 RepID=A0A1M5QCM9_9ACTN|nr:histidine kinase [Geodermatophilus nigrescens]SHH11529.1 Signal transduction histidine kinase [Geodermatophilus nigrescens]
MGSRQRVWPGLRACSIGFEAFVALLGAGTVTVGVVTPEARLTADAVLLVGGLLLVATLFLFRRSAPVVPFVVSAVLGVLVPALVVGMLLTAYAVGRYEGRWPVRAAAGVLGTVALVQPWAIGTPDEAVGALGGVAIALVLPAALGIWQRTRAQLLAALRERAARAEAERERLASAAVLAERTRIAREMHDAVGHRVSLMVLQAGAIEVAAADPDRVEQLAGQVQTAGRQALEELRQMVGVLRAGEVDEAAPLGPQPGLPELPRLVASAREAGMDVGWTGPAEGTAPVDPVVGRAAYRIVQESLTNAGRHAPDAPVQVTVERRPDELHVRVVNGPPARAAEPVPGGGFGLIGLGERVRTLGGRLRAEPRLDGGFCVEAELPA